MRRALATAHTRAHTDLRPHCFTAGHNKRVLNKYLKKKQQQTNTQPHRLCHPPWSVFYLLLVKMLPLRAEAGLGPPALHP